MDKAVLLREVGAVRQRDFAKAGFERGDGGADHGHRRLAREAVARAGGVVGVGWGDGGHGAGTREAGSTIYLTFT